MITFDLEDRSGQRQTVEVPEAVSLSLMEVLKASSYDVAGTCGGMALCASCHIEVVKGKELLASPGDAELDMLDTLPDATGSSRLACQIRITDALDGAVIRLRPAPLGGG